MANTEDPQINVLKAAFSTGRVPSEKEFDLLIDVADISRKAVGINAATDGVELPGFTNTDGVLSVQVDGKSLKIAGGTEADLKPLTVSQNQLYVVTAGSLKRTASGLALNIVPDAGLSDDESSGLCVKGGPGVGVSEDGICINAGNGLDFKDGSLTFKDSLSVTVTNNKVGLKVDKTCGLITSPDGLRINLAKENNFIGIDSKGTLGLTTEALQYLKSMGVKKFHDALEHTLKVVPQMLGSDYKNPAEANINEWAVPLTSMCHAAFKNGLDTKNIRSKLLGVFKANKAFAAKPLPSVSVQVVPTTENAVAVLNIISSRGTPASVTSGNGLYVVSSTDCKLETVVSFPALAAGYYLLIGSVDGKGNPVTGTTPDLLTQNGVVIYVDEVSGKKNVYTIGGWDIAKVIAAKGNDVDAGWSVYEEPAPMDLTDVMMARENLTKQLAAYQSSGVIKSSYEYSRITINSALADHCFYDQYGNQYSQFNTTTFKAGLSINTAHYHGYRNTSSNGHYNDWDDGFYAVLGTLDNATHSPTINYGNTLGPNAIMISVFNKVTSIIGYWDMVSDKPEWYDSEPDGNIYKIVDGFQKNHIKYNKAVVSLSIKENTATPIFTGTLQKDSGSFSLLYPDVVEAFVRLDPTSGTLTPVSKTTGMIDVVIVQNAMNKMPGSSGSVKVVVTA